MSIIWLAEPFQKNHVPSWLEKGRGSFFCEGRLLRPPEIAEEGGFLRVALNRCAAAPEYVWQKVSEKARIRLEGDLPRLQSGEWIRFKASLRLPHDFQNPGSFRFARYLHSQNIDLLGFVSDPSWILRIPAPPPESASGRLEEMRRRLRSTLQRENPGASGSFLLALLINDRRLLGKKWEEHFRNGGVSHILAISGLHVAMVSLLFLSLFRLVAALPFFAQSILFLRLYPLAAVFPVWLYVAAASFPVAAVRAGIMATLFLAGFSLWRRPDPVSALALAAILILSLSPLSLYTASFQLSFAAVLFLLLFFPRWRQLRWQWALPPPVVWLIDSLAVTAIAVLGTLPLLFLHFHQFSAAGFLANLVVLPLVGFFVMPMGMLGWVLTGLLGLEVPLLWKGAGFFSGWVLESVQWISARAEIGIFHGAFSFWQVVFYYSALGLLLIQRPFTRGPFAWGPFARGPFARGLAIVLILMAWMAGGGTMRGSGKLKITFIDVGQGDCAVIRLPNGKVWVVDGGGIRGSDWDVGRFVVAPYLWEEGIRRVDALFLSHPHHDHYKGLGFLAGHFHPKILFVNGDEAPESEKGEWDRFLSRAAESKMAVQGVSRLTPPLEEGEVRMEFLAPGPEGPYGHFNTNDNSAVFKLRYKNFTALLPGDLMEAGESALLESRPDLKSTLLKVGHHGSETSTTEKFLEAVDPQYAVIPVGAYNSYGMPSPEVLERLRKKGVVFFRTDTQGAVTFETDGHSVAVKTFVPRESATQ